MFIRTSTNTSNHDEVSKWTDRCSICARFIVVFCVWKVHMYVRVRKSENESERKSFLCIPKSVKWIRKDNFWVIGARIQNCSNFGDLKTLEFLNYDFSIENFIPEWAPRKKGMGPFTDWRSSLFRQDSLLINFVFYEKIYWNWL